MSEFHDNYPHYEVMANHSEDEGKKTRRTLWNVFWVMLVITIFELIMGSMAPGHGWSGHLWLKVLFIGLTLVKAAAIVLYFMHLGHEVKFFKYIVLTPYITFILYTIFIVLTEGTYSGQSGHFAPTDRIFVEQQENLKKGLHEKGAIHEHPAPSESDASGGGQHH